MAGADALSGKMFEEAAASALSKNLSQEIEASFSLSKKDFALQCTVCEIPADPPDESSAGSGAEDGVSRDDDGGDGDRQFTLSGIQVELYTLRGVANSDNIRKLLAPLSCPLAIRECLTDSARTSPDDP